MLIAEYLIFDTGQCQNFEEQNIRNWADKF